MIRSRNSNYEKRVNPSANERAKRIRPSRSERERLHRVTQQVIAAAESAIASRNLSATVEVIGSAARDTWISDDEEGGQDIDIFIGFDTSTSREDLERYDWK